MLKQASLALAVVVMVFAGANLAEARGRKCHSCCSGGGCASGCATDGKSASTTEPSDASKSQVAKEAPPAPTEEKTAEAKKSTTAEKTASDTSGSRRPHRLARR